MSTVAGAKARLIREFKDLGKERWLNIELKEDSLFTWTVALVVVNSDSHFNGGYFKAEMKFPSNYPYSPPEFRFLRPIFHPNIYENGNLCISILHPPGEDEMSGEIATERWSPLQGVESVLRSVLLLLDDPEVSSPANVDAGVSYRLDRLRYIEKAKVAVERSKNDIPRDFTMPTAIVDAPPAKIDDDEDFWAESGDEEFGGSDSSGGDADMMDFEEDGEEEQELDSEDEVKDHEAKQTKH